MDRTAADPWHPWNPWAHLKAQDNILVAFDSLDPVHGGGIYLPATRRRRAAIVLDRRLGQVDRNAVLAHELIHHERGHGSWSEAEARRECDRIWDEVARRLVPAGLLARLGWARGEAGGTFDVWDVAEEFRVPEDVARRALLLLDPRTRRRNREEAA